MNMLLGIAIMVLCLLLEALLVIVVIRYYARHQYLVRSPSVLTSLLRTQSKRPLRPGATNPLDAD